MHSRMRETPKSDKSLEGWINEFNIILAKVRLNRSIPELNNLEWHPLGDTYYTTLREGDAVLLLDTATDTVYYASLLDKTTRLKPPNLKLRRFSHVTWASIEEGARLAKELPIDQEARDVIYGDREQTYGHPSKNLQLIAEFWTSYLKGKEVLTCDDVCNMMILMKTARLKNMPDHRDSLVDTIGYTLLKERCIEPKLAETLNNQAKEEMETKTKQHKTDIETAMLHKISRSFTDPQELIKELNKP